MPKFSVVMPLEYIYNIEAPCTQAALERAHELFQRGLRPSEPVELSDTPVCSELADNCDGPFYLCRPNKKGAK